MKNQFRIALLLFVCIGGVLSSCEKQIAETSPMPASQVTEHSSLRSTDSDGELVLGRKLENPYATKQMKKALLNLQKNWVEMKKEPKIETNYLYVRFLPKDNDQFNTINSDNTVDLFEYPLDYEIKKLGNKYKDKTLPGPYTWLYAAIPKNKKAYKEIRMEVLEELYLPFGNGKDDDYRRSTSGLSVTDTRLLEALEDESLKLTGNAKPKGGRKVKDWNPNGRIQVNDDYKGLLPVEGCLARANAWFTTQTAYTDANGYFWINHSRNNGQEVNYSIKWDRDEFDIRSGNYGQAYFNGPKTYGSWYLEIREEGSADNYIYAHVHRAAFEYYTRNWKYGIQRPPLRSYGPFGGHKLHLGAKQGDGRSHYFDFNDAWFAAEVSLRFNLYDGGNRFSHDDSRDIFATTIHELAHVSHWSLGFNTALYLAHVNNRKLAESWAQGVEWYITNSIYNYPNGYFVDESGHQHYNLSEVQSSYYTPVFIDLIDNFNQSMYGSVYPNDNAGGYTLRALEDNLRAEVSNWYGYRDRLLRLNNNDQNIAWLFNNYD